ncbi:protein of unknown function DUF1089 [Beutenbergia cavernae DSM 12333]|uniref:Glycolipid-binding family protein n=1 Tax=Beutenbergia cavernae (strain ATCC BAA-8 / DSM 12333 / CCUG 43141 / JCM 11478 / NBRC 16432 / NCIMB 13614 / HKI 0122) TaxID=471853 RepID=C5C4V2_BEUC1|nr:putative glycolipid-binding domain-containing protein [Beutenbergia cavernae]ACQ80080.1 protein of unknown function DUF1089 [Beutenbergia cavernae DSM 12333]
MGTDAARRAGSVVRRRWHSSLFGTDETVTLAARSDGWQLAGVVTGPDDLTLDYVVDVDAQWATREARVDVTTRTGSTRLLLTRDAAGWWVDGVRDARFDGCVDVDLGFSPSTNTLPVRRLGLDVGDAVEIRALWLRYPELRVELSVQEYTRLAPRRWRYRSDGFEAELTVDGDGVVVTYGDDLWFTIDESED